MRTSLAPEVTTMIHLRRLAPALLAGALCLPAAAQSVGTSMPDKVALEGFDQTPARSYDDFYGRAVLIEFFAYW